MTSSSSSSSACSAPDSDPCMVQTWDFAAEGGTHGVISTAPHSVRLREERSGRDMSFHAVEIHTHHLAHQLAQHLGGMLIGWSNETRCDRQKQEKDQKEKEEEVKEGLWRREHGHCANLTGWLLVDHQN